ncbi:RagB/SusD family nutrient uptake outer membrane protein [Prolixibacteraceae bacterium JC049]|nr:RagB/SusD family nutrient uptake outer membrane protein [Prolixibacteraceae bacterium JC049]
MKKIIITALAGLALLFTACEKDIDLLPKDTLVVESFFKSANDYKVFVNTFYDQLPGFGLPSRDNDADIAYAGSAVSNSTYIESQQSGTWNGSYAAIRNHSLVIKGAEALEDAALKDQVQVYVAEARFFRAMAYYTLLREFGGVPLVDHPLGLNEKEILYGPRSTFEETVNFIVADLDAAIATKRLGSLEGAANVGRITAEAAYALKSRVCLFAGTWFKYHGSGGNANALLTQAKEAANSIISGGKFSLFKRDDVLGSLSESYRYLFTLESDVQSNPANLGKGDQSEFILVRKHNKEDRHGGYISVNSGNLSPTKKLIDMFLDNTGLPITHSKSVFHGHGFSIDADTKKPNNFEYKDRDPRMSAILIEPFTQFWYHTPYDRDFTKTDLTGTGGWNDGMWTSNTGYLLHKFIPETAGGVAIDYPVFRYAEILLNYAEAVYELDGSISDQDLNKSINLLRDRVEMPHLTNAFVTSNGLDMKQEIRRERTIELCFEGFRYDDLRRWKTAETEMKEDVKGVQWANSLLPTSFEVYKDQTKATVTVTNHINTQFETDADGFLIREKAADRQFESKHYLKPLPLRQIAINPQLKQNPGWASN